MLPRPDSTKNRHADHLSLSRFDRYMPTCVTPRMLVLHLENENFYEFSYDFNITSAPPYGSIFHRLNEDIDPSRFAKMLLFASRSRCCDIDKTKNKTWKFEPAKCKVIFAYPVVVRKR